MKINKIEKKRCKLIKLKLIRTKIYTKKNQLINIKIEDIEKRLKKSLKLIHAYHQQNKQILFIGSSLKMSDELKKVVKNTKHIVIPKFLWIPGIINNKKLALTRIKKKKFLNNNKLFKIVLQLKRKSDLIVLFDPQNNYQIVNESYAAKIPIISFGNLLNAFNTKTNYKIPGNFKFNNKKIRDNFLCSIITACLKKTKKHLSKK